MFRRSSKASPQKGSPQKGSPQKGSPQKPSPQKPSPQKPSPGPALSPEQLNGPKIVQTKRLSDSDNGTPDIEVPDCLLDVPLSPSTRETNPFAADWEQVKDKERKKREGELRQLTILPLNILKMFLKRFTEEEETAIKACQDRYQAQAKKIDDLVRQKDEAEASAAAASGDGVNLGANVQRRGRVNTGNKDYRATVWIKPTNNS